MSPSCHFFCHAISNRSTYTQLVIERGIRREVINYDYRPPGVSSVETRRTKSLPIVLFDNGALLEEKQNESGDPLMVFPGYGHGTKGTMETARWLADFNVHAVAVALPFNKLPPGSTALIEACGVMPHVVGKAIRDKYVLKKDALSALGQSQGGVVVGEAIAYDPDGIGDAAVVASVGFRDIGEMTKTEVCSDLIFRFVDNARLQSLTEYETWRVGCSILKQLAFDVSTNRFTEKVWTAMNRNLPETLIKHALRGNQVVMVLGEDDPVFPPKESIATLEAVPSYALARDNLNLTILPVPGAHDSPNSRRGKQQLLTGVQALQRDRLILPSAFV